MKLNCSEKWAIGGAVGVLLAAIGFEGYKHYKSSSAANVGALVGNSAVTLAPGAMTPVILSYGKGEAVTVNLPAGASFSTAGTAISSNNPTVIDTSTLSASTPIAIKPAAQGQSTLTFSWVDTKGVAQSSNFLVTVQS